MERTSADEQLLLNWKRLLVMCETKACRQCHMCVMHVAVLHVHRFRFEVQQQLLVSTDMAGQTTIAVHLHPFKIPERAACNLRTIEGSVEDRRIRRPSSRMPCTPGCNSCDPSRLKTDSNKAREAENFHARARGLGSPRGLAGFVMAPTALASARMYN